MGRPGPKKGSAKIAGSGRKKGSINRRTRDKQEAIEATLERLGVNPFVALALLACGDKVALGVKQVPLSLRFDAARELAGYLAPKRKAIEVSGPAGGPVQVDHGLDYSRLSLEERHQLYGLVQKAKPVEGGEPSSADSADTGAEPEASPA